MIFIPLVSQVDWLSAGLGALIVLAIVVIIRVLFWIVDALFDTLFPQDFSQHD